jgi:Ras-related protein Rab-11B
MHSRVGWKIYWHTPGHTHVFANLDETPVMVRSELAMKVIIAGDGGVGKTTLLRKFVSGSFDAATSMTIGVQFHVKQVAYDGQPVSLQLWDLGGQDHFRFILPSYTSGAKGALLLYDMTRPSTLDTLGEWVKICRTHNKDLPILFCGTKADLVGSRRISAAYARTFLEPLDLVSHIEVSAKTGVNVERAFEMIIDRMIR